MTGAELQRMIDERLDEARPGRYSCDDRAWQEPVVRWLEAVLGAMDQHERQRVVAEMEAARVVGDAEDALDFDGFDD